MLRTHSLNLLTSLSRIGADPADSPDQRLRKALLVYFSLMFIAAGAAWGVFYILFGEPLAGVIPLGYAVFSALSVGSFVITRRYELFRHSQLLLIFICERRGTVVVKGKGEMETWYLLGLRSAEALNQPARLDEKERA